MATALYYPHTTIQSTGLVKSALLLWDNVECIMPNGRSVERPSRLHKDHYEALDILVKPRIPTLAEKRLAAASVVKFLREVPPKSLFYAPKGSLGQRYLMYPEKFSPRLWQFLERHGLARFDAASADFNVPPALGLMMMSMLGDICAGTQREMVTDRIDAYSWIAEYLSKELGGTYVTDMDASEVGVGYDRLVTISLDVLGARQIPLKKLVALRKREIRSGSSDYRLLRKRYRDSLSTCVNRIRREARTKSDVREIERQFREDIKQDLKDLKDELNLATIKLLFSKEMAIYIAACAGALCEPISGITTLAVTLPGIGVAPLVKSGSEYRAARKKALRDSPMSWLYLAKKGPLPLR